MRSKAKNLSSLFHSALKKTPITSSSSKPTTPNLKTLEKSLLPSTTISTLEPVIKLSKKSNKGSSEARLKKLPPPQLEALHSLSQETLFRSPDESDNEYMKSISVILGGSNTVLESQTADDGESTGKSLEIPWFSYTPHAHVALRRKETSRERKQKWIFKDSQGQRFDRLIQMCGNKLGAKTTVEVFGKLGRETGLKEYNALVGLCVEKARTSEDAKVWFGHMNRAYHLLTSMKEQGFQLEEKTYGPLLMYLIDMRMVEKFQTFCEVIRDDDYAKFPRLGYYEMLLWIRAGNDDKVQELCDSIADDAENGEGRSILAESYVLALCESDRKKELLQVLEAVGITKVLSWDSVSDIFKFSGRLLLESFAENLILTLKTSEVGAEKVSYFICDYAVSMPNLAVEDVISKSKQLHKRLDVIPSSTSFEKLIRYCCDSLKVHEALHLVDQMCQLDLTLSKEIFNPILRAIEDSCEFDLVHQIYSVICRHKLMINGEKAYGEIFRSLINLCVKIKDFEGAYEILNDLKKMDMKPTSSMYNAILAGYFREKNSCGALMVINQMKRADVKPDSQTFSYLIGNAESEADIIKYYEELHAAGVQATKHVYMSLVNAYINCGLIEMAKQVVLDEGIPVKNINEIKSVLVSALASSGQMSDAIKVYEEIKDASCNVEPKAIICLIEHVQSEGELDRLLMLLRELDDLDFWCDACGRVISYCVRYKYLSSAIDLLKQLHERDTMSTDAVLDQVFCQISEADPTALEMGMDILLVIKEDLKLSPSRTSLDFLLSACVSAKDKVRGWFVWEEYQKAGLPINVLTYLRMYQLLLASGEWKAAKLMLKKVPLDDPHVRYIINACKETFRKPDKSKSKSESESKKK